MSFIKRLAFLIAILAIVITLYSCSAIEDTLQGQDDTQSTEDPSNSNNEKPSDEGSDNETTEKDPSDKKDDDTDNGDGGEDTPLEDGLSEDGTFYRLTDKNGVVVHIPVGVPLNIASNGSITEDRGNVRKMRSRPAASETEADYSDQRSVCIFSTLSTYSIGYGAIKHPCEDGYINNPSGNPYTVDDQHALVIQCFDENYNEVSKDDPNVYYISIYVLDYLTDPGHLMFSETIDYSYAEGITLNYFTFSNIVVGVPYVQKSIDTSYDEDIGDYVTTYYMSERVTLRTPEGFHDIELKWYYCNSDWATITRHEYTFDDYFNPTAYFIYDHLDRIVYTHKIDKNGDLYDVYSYEFYPDGNPKLISEPDLYKAYDENGNIIELRKKTVTSSGCYVWDCSGINESGDRWHSISEYKNNKLVKEIYYYENTDAIKLIQEFDGDGNKIAEKSYTESGDLCLIEEYEYSNSILVKSSFKSYESGNMILYGHTVYYSDGTPKDAVTYYANGNKADDMHWESDGSSMTWNLYSEDGKLTQRQIYTYTNGITTRLDVYQYGTEEDSTLVTHTVTEYDELGQDTKYTTYENDILTNETYVTGSGYITYDYVQGYIYYYDSDYNLIDKKPIG